MREKWAGFDKSSALPCFFRVIELFINIWYNFQDISKLSEDGEVHGGGDFS
jgi:hypothetical protein